MSETEQAAVRDCARWSPLRRGERHRAERNPLLADAIEAEDRIL